MVECKTFQTPQMLYYQQNALQKLGFQAKQYGQKALIVSDKIMEELGNVQKCIDLLSEVGVESAIFLEVNSEPTDEHVAAAMSVLEKEQCDLVVSIGGGSCIDTAKAVAILATNGGYIGDYMNQQKIASKASLPHIAIPTTAGTGSEATDVTVITNTSNHVKMMIKQPVLMPTVAIVDPLLSVSSPKSVTAATGVDALCHAIEAYISKKAQPMTDVMALSAMKYIVRNLKAAYDDGENITAREGMAIGALQAGMAFSNASVCLVHGMSRPIGALFNVPHGFSNAMLLPAVLEYSRESCVERLADLGRLFAEEDTVLTNEQAADVAVESVKELCKYLSIPNLKEWGIEEEAFNEAIDKMADDALDSGSPGNNPKVPTKEEIKALYETCYTYAF